MPVLQIQALPQKPGVDVERALKRVCVALAEVYGCKPGQVWATWSTAEAYVEGDREAKSQPDDTHPPIGTLTCFEGRPSETIARMLETAALMLGEELRIPGNLFLTYVEAKSGRVFTGGSVRR